MMTPHQHLAVPALRVTKAQAERMRRDAVSHEIKKMHQGLGEYHEKEILNGCARCRQPLIENGQPKPGARRIIMPTESPLFGRYYCGECTHELGYGPEPGNDYAI